MAKWTAFPHDSKSLDYPGDQLWKHWERLHAGDREPWPEDEASQEAWRAYHRGDFQNAVALGLKAETASGMNAANKAQSIYATYLVDDEDEKKELFEEVVERAEMALKEHPNSINAHYQHAYALGRYSQAISIAKALTQGLAGKCKASLDKTLALAPAHAEAHIALGAYHAEIIGKVGSMVGSLTYGVSKDAAEAHYEKALELIPHSAIARIEYGNGLLTMYGNKKVKEATRLYEAAAESDPKDAMEVLDVEFAKSELTDD
jgi:tetratricopeptide (TPR) repeat protein